MDWKSFWNQVAESSQDPNSQVARIGGHGSNQSGMLDRIVEHISEGLDLQPSDRLMDVCCGNGALTSRLAKRCDHVVGVDLSNVQIDLANASASGPNISYAVGNAATLNSWESNSFDKISLYFSFQYLDRYALGFASIESMARLLKPGGCMFIGDVPDSTLIRAYYPKRSQVWKHRIKRALGKNDMGKFWSEGEIRRICRQLGLKYERLIEPQDLPYAHYRVDYRIFKPN
ncbi:methyltransferase domain-containing protein [Pontibacter sp. G13]|uniref:class I SAM-dependent methyltransferase n=1 Tax=Pontibacter sp. G13 TaxID=3074898 RepID=UPI002889C282|nr:methyltransferase domain-containing protein [Pontibacter sp. G13]WNJ16139.1 methyltransferase domain-containing protein [Pontibacter sp. G13]